MISDTKIVGALCAVAGVLLACSDAAMGQAGGDTPRHVVRVSSKTLRDVGNVGLTPLLSLDYGTFAWLELSDTDFVSLQASGVPYEERQDAYTLALGDQRFDPLQNAPVHAPGWGGVGAVGPDLHLVQFVGPTRDEWLLDLETRGLKVVQYIYPFT